MTHRETAPIEDFLAPPDPKHDFVERLKIGAAVAGLYLTATFVHNTETTVERMPHSANPGVSDYAEDDARYVLGIQPIEAKPSDAVKLSDDWGGVLGTEGFSIVIDESKIVPQLEPRQMVVVQETDVHYHMGILDKVGDQRQAFFAEDTELYPEFGLSPEQEKFIEADTSNSSTSRGLGSATQYADVRKNDNLVALGDGLVSHAVEPAELSYKKYELDGDGGIVLLEEKAATAARMPNVACGGVENPVFSEVELTAAELQTICSVLESYGAILPDDYEVTLDSAFTKARARDSVMSINNSILLTYPSVANKEVSGFDLQFTAIHEILHTTYEEIDRNTGVWQEAEVAHLAITVAAKDVLSTPSASVEDTAWSVIKESTYEPSEPNAGHPWDEPTEMLSSTGAILAFYPEEFVAKYTVRSPAEQAGLLSAVQAVGSLIKAVGVEPDEVIPAYSQVLAQIQPE